MFVPMKDEECDCFEGEVMAGGSYRQVSMSIFLIIIVR